MRLAGAALSSRLVPCGSSGSGTGSSGAVKLLRLLKQVRN